MASADIFSSVAPSSVPTATSLTVTEVALSALTETTIVEPLTINDIKMFESIDLDSSGSNSSGIGNSNEVIEGSLDETDSLLEDASQCCKICKEKLRSPRVLNCLHVFCEECIDGLLKESDDPLNVNSTLECPDCHQATAVAGKAATLPPDYVLTNILDLSSMDAGALQCTSCKSAEKAISRCSECAHMLCESCDNAHKYMRCFENHHVVILDQLRSSDEKVAIHKPIFCATHNSENLKYYCFKCEVPVCNDCVVGEHKGSEHHYELLGEAEKLMRNDIDDLMAKAKNKITYCDEASTNLGNALTELQNQHDTAHTMITDTYKRCKKILDECRDRSLKDLERLHSERELKIMDLLHNVEKSVEKTETACKFTNKLLQASNATEFLCMKKLIAAQFAQLISDTPKVDLHFSLEFDSKVEKFEQLTVDAFGKFRTESTPPSPKESTPPPTLPGLPPTVNKVNIPCNSSQSAMTGSVTASSPISLPTSMQSSFDGDISNMGASFLIPPSALTPDTTVRQPPTQNNNLLERIGPMALAAMNGGGGASSDCTNLFNQMNKFDNEFENITEYNLHRLANLADSSHDIPDGMPPSQPSPAPQFTLADLISNERAFNNNLQALCKLGNFNNNELSTNAIPNHRPESVSLLTDYPMASSTSPVGTIASLNENMNGLNGLNGINGLNGTNGLNGMNGINSLGGLNLNSGGSIPGRIKATPMHIRYKFGSLGPSRVQFNSPHGFCLGVDEEIIVADTNNHRIEIFEKDGTFKMQFGVPGKEEGQLWYPRKVAVMRSNSKFVVCDRGNERSRMQIFTKNGHFIKKIAIRYIDIVAGLAVSNEGHIVAVDSVSPTVFVISEDGDLVHWFDCSDHMREPSDIAINGNDFYVCDFKGHCVAVFGQDGTFKYRIGNEKITCFPNGIDISDAGDILIGDSHGNRFHVACFSRDGILQSEFECPHVKVSRCCGLKITSEGYVVTLAKNNHHVLVLNTLYIQ